MYDLSAIGDALIDFTPSSGFEEDRPVYQCNVGGTVCNLVVAAAKLGLETMFVGKVGDDCMGDLIHKEMKRYKVDLSGYVKDKEHFTTQSFVTLQPNGERNFSFSRRYGADIFLKINEVPVEKMMDTVFLHFSGMCMTDEPIRNTTFEILKEAKKREKIVTVDVNYRSKLWKSEEDMVKTMWKSLQYVTLFKSSDEEAFLLTGEKTLDKAAAKILELGCKIVIISCGEKGCYYSYYGGHGQIPSYRVKAVDTTGAGDCFLAGFLYQLRNANDIDNISEENIISMLRFANAAGALTTTRKGGVAGAPSIDEIEACIKETPILNL